MNEFFPGQKDTIISVNKILVQHPFDDILDVSSQGMADTGVDIILVHLLVRHGRTLKNNRMYIYYVSNESEIKSFEWKVLNIEMKWNMGWQRTVSYDNPLW